MAAGPSESYSFWTLEELQSLAYPAARLTGLFH